MKKPVRFLIYAGMLAFAWFILSPALSINSHQIGAPLREFFSGWNSLAIAASIFALALVITYLITSGWGLVLLGAGALVGLVVVSILHPYLFPLLVPLFGLWLMCALARRKERAQKAGA